MGRESNAVSQVCTNGVPAVPEGDRLANYLTMVGHICSDINQGALSAVLPFLVVSGGYSYVEATMLIFAANIASAVIQPLFGWLGDRRPCPWFMALGVFLAGLGMAAIGYAQGYGFVVGAAVVSGIGVAMFHPEGGRLANLAAGVHKGTGMSVFAVGGNIGFFIGPLLAAFFLTTFGLRGTLVFAFPATACAVVLVCFNGRFERLGTASGGASATGEEHWGLFALVMGVLSLRSIFEYGLTAFIPLFLVGMLGQGEAVGSMAISLFAIAGAAATVMSGRAAERVGAIRLMVACALLTGLAMVAFALNSAVCVAFALVVVLAMGADLFYASTVALGMGYVPRHLGMASGLSYGVAVCVGGVAEPFLGMLGDAFGLVPVMLAMAAVALLTSALGVVLKRAHAAKMPM